MYSASQIKTGLQKPERVVWEAGRLFHRKLLGKSGCDIMAKDWDNLIILDACRYDMFEEVCQFDGTLDSVISAGSSTPEFLRKNFLEQEREHADTVYISGNPQTRSHGVDSLFYESIPVWKEEWDDELSTVHPEDFTNSVKEVADKYPNKRLIIHYVQPHYPFIGEEGKQIDHRTFHGDGVLSNPENTQKSVWERLEEGSVSKNTVWSAYRENLEIVLPYVKDLSIELTGKTIVTSDHGNVLGKYGVYGHPSKHYIEELVKVPWFEFRHDERKSIEEGQVSGAQLVNESVEERLADLGYR